MRRVVFAAWLKARRVALLYIALIFGIYFVVYAVYGYVWGVAGYAFLLCAALGLPLAVYDFGRFYTKHKSLARIVGRFPPEFIPEAANLTEQDYTDIIQALEAERARLCAENERANRDAQEYYTLWVHQVKTPIAAMRLLLQSAQGGLDRQGVAAAGQEMFRIEQYVDMALQYQRINSLQNDLLLERVEVAAMVKKAAKNTASLFIHKGLPLNTGNLQGAIVTDEKWFCFVLEQLFTNAVKYTDKGSIMVHLEDGCVLVVEDEGAGIAAEDVPRVFERGFTGAVGRSERSSTGIGLYLCREILNRLGFGISIESVKGKGTRVLLNLGQDALEIE